MFRALDTETGKSVAVRRFFPFGAAGGGLHADEQNAYNTAINRLAGVSHPALRSIICGGCDPVDGMPYIATEWIEGEPLDSFIEHDPLSAEVATEVITRALEVSELLSQALAQDAVWVETHMQTIIVGNTQSSRGITFWICPLKWLANQEQARGMESIVGLTENIMAWQGGKINDQAGHGLAAWLTWLRQAEGSISLHDARATLAAMVRANPRPSKKMVRQGTRPPPRAIARPSSKVPWIINGAIALIAIGLGGRLLIRQRALESSTIGQHPEQALAINTDHGPAPSATGPLPSAQQTAEPLTKTKDVATTTLPPAPKTTQPLTKTQDVAATSVEVISSDNHELLLLKEGEEVTVEGRLKAYRFLGSRKNRTMYLLFSQESDEFAIRGVVHLYSAPQDSYNASIKPLVGKKIRLQGNIKVKIEDRIKRLEIHIKDLSSVKPME